MSNKSKELQVKDLKFGTKEWAEVNKNILRGCKNDCRYCFARYNAVKRFKTVKPGKWTEVQLIEKELTKKPKKYDGTIMFPTQHDLFYQHLNEVWRYLYGLLDVGNKILIVTKPQYGLINELTHSFPKYQDQIIFRFTIGSMNQESLKFWEPGAPGLSERLHCLELATERGYQTSVSCEPYFDTSIIPLVYLLLQYVTETIWIGKMNFVEQRVDTTNFSEEDNKFLGILKHVSTTEYVKQIYQEFVTHPVYAQKVQWKESIKKIIIREGWE